MGRRLSAALAVLVLSACASTTGGSGATDWSRVASASDGGGFSELVTAARHEGVVDIPSGLGYATLVAGFESRYHIDVVLQPAATDAQQMADPALDVYTVALDTAAAQTARLAPYLVFYWKEIPAELKAAKAYWYESCGGFISVDDQDSASIGSLADLLRPGFTVGVGEGATVAAVVTAALANGGSVDDLAPGVEFFHALAQNGGLGRSPANTFIGWNYLFTGRRHFTPDTTVAAYDVQAINRDAPHPAAARLWEEYLFSDSGQNLCVARGARPSRLDAMRADGVLDLAAAAALDPVPAHAVTLTPAEMADARAYVAAHWAAAVGQ